ncbi:MAG: OmpA family protein [Saprospiraceae bacterium]|nr:OmpA family protein [Saprospiraceae bacterium]MCB0574979.1 OmpA family protein [Saprospiraceae bacterium]MCB9353569.1 OmpA family protein [Lewinellaceae bacterium]
MKTTALIILSVFCSLFLVFCTYTLKIKDGHTAFDRKQYAVATPLLSREFDRAKTRTEKGRLAFELAESYRQQGLDEQSLEWYKTAYDNNYGPEALKGYAYALKKLERYAAARDAFKDLGIEIGSPYEYRREITACNVAEGWLKEATDNGWKVESAAFNSPQNDFSPVFYRDGRLVFSSDRAMSNSEESYKWTGNKFMDLFIVEPDGASPQIFDSGLNTAGNEGTAAFSADGREMFFARAVGAYKGDDAYCKIYVAEKTGDRWGDPRPLPFQKEKINYLHPALSPDGNTLYFSCNDPEGWGGYDLYAVQRNTKMENGWDFPKLLSRNLNTPGNEVFPVVDSDTLYFASDGLPGMGGLDIFRSYRSARNAWAPPINLKSPVNSGADDFAFIVDYNARTEPRPSKPGDLIRAGFFTSNRPDGRGGDDIYRFEQRVPPPRPPKVDTVPAKPLVYKMVLEGYVLEKIFSVSNDPNSKVLGRKPLAGASVQVDVNGKKETFLVKDDGFFRMELEENTDYAFTASLKEYLTNKARFSTRGIARDPATPEQTFEIEIVLDKIYHNREIVLENIYYDYDKWDIRPDAEPTLNRLAEVLKQNPGIRIQLGSHTDCRGNDRYNEDLSQKRAQSAVNYLISKGIDANKLSAVGYGETQPAVSCICTRCTESEHQANRRTTFKVVE